MSGPVPVGAEQRPAGKSQLAEEQAALRRVATLAARQTSQAELFTAVAEELGRVLGVESIRMVRYDDAGDGRVQATVVATWGSNPEVMALGECHPLGGENVTTEVFETGRSARRDDYSTASGPIAEAVRAGGVEAAVAAPIMVAGRLWGAMIAKAVAGGPFPPDTEVRLGNFTELMGVAIANAESRGEVGRLADEQAALRRVATMVAEAPAAAELFAKVAEAVARLLGSDIDSAILRYEADGTAMVVAVCGKEPLGGIRVGARLAVDGSGVAARVMMEKRPVRVDAYRSATGVIAEHAKKHGIRSAVGCPILVQGVLWGAIVVAHYRGQPFPRDTERRVAQFTELIATAISNTEARSEVQRLAEEQAALRRVATLVAKRAEPVETFDAVIAEAGRLLGAEQVGLARYEGTGEITILAMRGDGSMKLDTGIRVPLDGDNMTLRVLETERPGRIHLSDEGRGEIVEIARAAGVNATVGAPVRVDGRLWGVIAASWKGDVMPAPGAERRLAGFAELLDTAIAEAEARAQLQRLAREQAALRRVATLVAEGAIPAEVFEAVIVEVAELLDPAQVGLLRVDGPDEVTILAHLGQSPDTVYPGMRLPLDGDSVTSRVLRAGRSARLNHYEGQLGSIASIAKGNSVSVAVGAPVTVEGRLWGVITASWQGEHAAPPDAEERLAEFAALLDTAIANADGRDQLTASRARVLSAGDEARRRVVRDLHDGAQQRLVHTIVSLQLAQRALGEDDERASSLLGEALEHARRGNLELRELAHGILPSVLTRGGLRAAVEALVSRLDLPVEHEVTGERLALDLEASAYFIVAEALTNVVKHSRAGRAQVSAETDAGVLRVEVRDDGIGGVSADGPGLLGIVDRVAALEGRLSIDSPPGRGTLIVVELPLSSGAAGPELPYDPDSRR